MAHKISDMGFGMVRMQNETDEDFQFNAFFAATDRDSYPGSQLIGTFSTYREARIFTEQSVARRIPIVVTNQYTLLRYNIFDVAGTWYINEIRCNPDSVVNELNFGPPIKISSRPL